MVEGRLYKPVIETEYCQTCHVCRDGCPAELIPEYREEEASLRGLIFQGSSTSTRLPGAEPSSFPACQRACPIHQDTSQYGALIANKKFKEALELIYEVNPLPAVCGYICHHPCEEACLRGKIDQPIPLRLLKRFVAEMDYNENLSRPSPLKNRPEKILIVGSGPAGLTAAHDLRLLGYQVTITESLPVLGGMLTVGIPAFRLPRAILQKEFERIRGLGIEMITRKPFLFQRTEKMIKDLGFQAAYLAIGAHKSRRLFIQGERLPGVFPGVEWLKQINLGAKIPMGKKVIILGGGNVAVDVARVVVRLGTEQVEILYRRSKKEMPAIPEEVAVAQREGVRIHFKTSPTAIRKSKKGGLELECLKMRPGETDDQGRRKPVPIEGSNFFLSADLIVTAVGQEVDSKRLTDFKINPDGTIWVDPKTNQTSLKGVFAGGDSVTGPGWAIEAIADGKRGAASIHEYLS